MRLRSSSTTIESQRRLHRRGPAVGLLAHLRDLDAVHAGLGRADRVDHQDVRQQLHQLVLDRLREDRRARADRDERRQVELVVDLLELVGERPRHRVAGDAERR